MNFKKSLLVFCLIICILFCISSVAAGDANAVAISSDDINANEEILAVNNEISDDKLSVEENNDAVAAADEKVNDDNSVLTVKNDEQPLSSDGAEKVKITVYKQTGDYATNKKLYFRATDSSNNPVYVPEKSLKIDCTVAGKNYKILTSTNSNGEGSFNWPDSKMTVGGTFTMKLFAVSISGCKVGYDPSTVKVSVKPKTTKQTAATKSAKQAVTIKAKALSATYKSGKKFAAKVVKTSNGKAVKGVPVNAIVYTGNSHKTIALKSNAKGNVVFSTGKLGVGTHKVVLKIKSNKKYAGKAKTTSIKIVKKKSSSKSSGKSTGKLRTKLTINECYRTNSIAEYYFKVTLKDSKGKALANKNIQIKTLIDMFGRTMSKTDSIKTDSKGVAKGYVNAMFGGITKFDATFTFAGDKSYYSSSASKYLG
ncbi:hypothetical protein [uncultured Methanobrevibacter sp.]|uniref:hypothetical protein n=1 Tax=uncultured Methanobrevibacter sp. TaxID=253161 RepID=UPI0025E637A2|nr:hypothetical protein [uncultured Methanobrevibacter sp.]